MAKNVIMPKLGATMEEGRILKWLVNVGDKVDKDTPLLEVESDKATLEVESLFEGTILKILHEEDDVVPVLQTIAIVGKPGEDVSHLLDGNVVAQSNAPTEEVKIEKEVKINEGNKSEGVSAKSTPAAKHMAKQHGIDIGMVTPNQNGIITGKEIDEYIKEVKIKATPVATKIAQANDISLDKITQYQDRIYKEDVFSYMNTQNQISSSKPESQKMKGIRKTIATRMLKAWQTIPMAENTVEVDVSESLKLYEDFNKRFAGKNVKINITDILIKVIATAVKQYPEVNSFLDVETIVHRDQINVGVAVALENGLIVPVIRNVDQKGLLKINEEKKDLASRAKEGCLTVDEMNGASITLSNLGAYGVDVIKPIINMPEICIVGVGKITKKPVVVNDEIVIRPMMWISVVFDHRVLDGAPAAKLNVAIKNMLEEPKLLIY